MPVILHATQPAVVRTRSNIPIRRLVSAALGAEQSEVWEQVMPSGSHIPRHYHLVEESITFLTGQIEVTIGQETTQFMAPATVFVPAHEPHSITNIGGEPAHMLVFFPGIDVQVLYP
jgi:quercetin dioxygenase-like cupin family protein